MLRTLKFRIVTTSILSLAGCLSLNAQAQAPATSTITYYVADNIQLSKAANPIFPVRVTVADPAGIQSVRLSSPVGSGVGQLRGALSGSIGVTFFAGYYPVGTYTFTTSVRNMKGVRTAQSVTIHLNP